jgi:hypothetical protein
MYVAFPAPNTIRAPAHVLTHPGAECKRHKIKCDQVAGEVKCAKCLRSGAECLPYNMNQRLLDEDAACVLLSPAGWSAVLIRRLGGKQMRLWK